MRMKKKRHGTERLSLLSKLTVDIETTSVNEIKDLYFEKKPLRVEIGCGKGDFIRGKSVADPEYNYLAIEKISDVCTVAVEKYATSRGLGTLATRGGWQKEDGEVFPLGSGVVPFTDSELGNVRFCVGNAEKMLDTFPDSSVDALFINFCDPWSKKGYAKRRLTHINFLEKYSRILVPKGKIYFKTDNIGLFDFSLEQFGISKFSIEYKTNDLHSSEMNETNIQTEYERNFSEKGFLINMLIAENNK